MIVTCSDCATRYLVDPRALGTSGRVVRCANCSHTWHQEPPEDAPRRIEVPTFELEPFNRGATRIQLPVVAKPRRSVVKYASWLVILLILLAAGAGLVLERGPIVAFWPSSAALYQMIGLSAGSTERVFDLRNIQTRRATENDQPTFVITGEVVNVTPLTHVAPKVKVSLRDADDHELQAWSIPLTEDRLLPGQTVPFRTSISQPNDAAASVSVVLVDGG